MRRTIAGTGWREAFYLLLPSVGVVFTLGICAGGALHACQDARGPADADGQVVECELAAAGGALPGVMLYRCGDCLVNPKGGVHCDSVIGRVP
ncbi:MAG: hypothetical protein CMD39_07400 [Gammaproteobacteria bacterium]|nr:hypothetical protein [Gammaproteobacteria bacterium]